jgi:uncharacterized protein
MSAPSAPAPPAGSARPATRQLAKKGVFLSARWHALVMLNYEIDPAVLEPLVPPGTLLDTHDGRTYVSMVGFLFLRTRVLGVPIPFHRHFEEVNLRFYVRREVAGEVRRGVCFIREIVPRWAIAATARWTYNEPYLALPMRHHVTGPVSDFVRATAAWQCRQCEGPRPPRCVDYAWKFAGRWNSLSVTHDGASCPLEDGSHEQFIAEHYWGYCRQRDGGTVEYEVTHPSWCVWRGSDARLDCDVAALYGKEFEPFLSGPPVTAFLADGSEVAVLKPRRIA